MGSSDHVVADDQHFYSTWTDNRDPHLTHANQPDVRFAKIPKDLNGLSSDLGVGVAAAADVLPVVGATNFTVTVANAGPDDAPYVEATVKVPADFAITSVETGQGTCVLTEENKVSCALGTLALGGTTSVVVHTDAGVTPGPAVVTASVNSVGTDPRPTITAPRRR